jgi:hypothetical protein
MEHTRDSVVDGCPIGTTEEGDLLISTGLRQVGSDGSVNWVSPWSFGFPRRVERGVTLSRSDDGRLVIRDRRGGFISDTKWERSDVSLSPDGKVLLVLGSVASKRKASDPLGRYYELRRVVDGRVLAKGNLPESRSDFSVALVDQSRFLVLLKPRRSEAVSGKYVNHFKVATLGLFNGKDRTLKRLEDVAIETGPRSSRSTEYVFAVLGKQVAVLNSTGFRVYPLP